ncbi:MAG: hypothetical protein JWN25_1797 [Verrucomicrobiales bacterium]|nr:hypothetical protein [Verrucomicrobiales bacterium]
MLLGFRCERCEHEWFPRELEQQPQTCPKCKSPYWHRPRKVDISEENRVTSAWTPHALDGKTVEYNLARGKKSDAGFGFFSASDLGDGTMQIIIRPITGEPDIKLIQDEADLIKTHQGKYRFSCFSRS